MITGEDFHVVEKSHETVSLRREIIHVVLCEALEGNFLPVPR
jgi:hypothetical protein